LEFISALAESHELGSTYSNEFLNVNPCNIFIPEGGSGPGGIKFLISNFGINSK